MNGNQYRSESQEKYDVRQDVSKSNNCSKRVYKDAMSFEKADSIITEGMGKHFDKALEPYYVLARPKLEAYYSQIT